MTRKTHLGNVVNFDVLSSVGRGDLVLLLEAERLNEENEASSQIDFVDFVDFVDTLLLSTSRRHPCSLWNSLLELPSSVSVISSVGVISGERLARRGERGKGVGSASRLTSYERRDQRRRDIPLSPRREDRRTEEGKERRR